MQHMYDPTGGVARREDRTLDVNDITGKRGSGTNSGLPPVGPGPQRIAPIRPKMMEYDIINPVGEKLRMSAYGKNVIGSRGAARRSVDATTSSPAGKKQMPKQGESNMVEIWPADESLRQEFDQRQRGLQTHDINVNHRGNARLHKLQAEDQERIRKFMVRKEREQSQRAVKTYKNASNVFNHLVDDPKLRQKATRNSQYNGSAGPGSRGGDVLDRMLQNDDGLASQVNGAYGSYDAQAAQDIAYRADFQPLNLSANGEQPSGGQPSRLSQNEMQKGKRAFGKDHMNVATGQARLFGAESSDASKAEQSKRSGKRIIQMPHMQNQLM